MSTTLLVCWELGDGLGHIGALAGVLALLPATVRIVAVVRSPERAKNWFPEATKYLPAPALTRSKPPVTVSYGDVLYGLGWHRPEVLGALTAQWTDIFREVRPTALLIENAPGALLANRSAGLPTICLSGPWGCPAGGIPMRPILEAANARGRAASSTREAEMVRALNTLPGVEIRGLSELFSPHHHWVKGLPEADPNHGRRDGPVTHLGAMGFDGGGATTEFPAGPGGRIFCYLKPDYSKLGIVLDHLAQRGQPALAYVPGHRSVTRGSLRIVGDAVHLQSLVATADLLITHSIVGTGYLFASEGVPVLLLPTHSEQVANSLAAASLGGVEWMSGPAVARELGAALHQMLSPEARLAAARTADKLAAYPDPYQRMADTILESLH